MVPTGVRPCEAPNRVAPECAFAAVIAWSAREAEAVWAAWAWLMPTPATVTARAAVARSVTLERIWILQAVGEENPCDPPTSPACPPRWAMAPAVHLQFVVLHKPARVQE